MSDIFDEKFELRNVRSLVAMLRDEYENELRHGKSEVLPRDEFSIRGRIVAHWPGDEVVSQLVKDTCRVLVEKNINPRDIK